MKYDFLKPGNSLSLDMTLGEAELLMSASPEVRAIAEKGELKAIHDKCKQTHDKVDAALIKTREHMLRLLQQVEEKEN